jgi:hypothetical protein
VGEWTVYLRAPDRTRAGQIEDFQQCDAVPRFNDVGTWALDLDSRAPLAVTLTEPGYGIEIVREGTVVMSGDMRFRKRTRDGSRSRILVSGYDDTVWLHRRLAHPQPATVAPPYSVNEHDVRTGTCSTVLRAYVDVNAGPSALAVRRVAGLTLAADPLVGASVTGRGRWQHLLTLLQELALAGGGLGFRITRSGTDRVFTVYQPADLTSTVKFSIELGNLAGYEYESEAPSANYIVVGGGGEGTARTIREGQDPSSVVDWGRIEAFRDRRDTTATAELDQEITKQLEESAGRTGISITPVETEALRYLTDYTLGDKVTAVLDGEPVREVIREVRIKLTPDGPQQTLPDISSAGRPEVLRIFRLLRATDRRLTNLERR